jgi:hypothetical protein
LLFRLQIISSESNMSSIPNSAMPHAGPSTDEQNSQGQSGQGQADGQSLASRAADLVRENPKAAIAAGAAVAAGVAAGVAIRARRSSGAKSTDGGSSGSKGSSRKKS